MCVSRFPNLEIPGSGLKLENLAEEILKKIEATHHQEVPETLDIILL